MGWFWFVAVLFWGRPDNAIFLMLAIPSVLGTLLAWIFARTENGPMC